MRPMTPDDLYSITWVGDAAISPDGRRVAFVATKMDRESDSYRSAIWVVDTAEGEPAQFTSGTKRDTAPRWSPDGRWLAFVSERGEEKPQLALMPADGGESRILTKLPFGVDAPIWSPDSNRIAFSARTGVAPDPDPKKAKPYRRISSMKYRMNGEGFTYDRRRHLFVIGLEEGAEPTQITDGDWDDGQPAFSPDGRSLAFVSARHEERDYDRFNDLWRVGEDGGELTKLTETNLSVGGPSWSPDGTTIAYTASSEESSNGLLHLCDSGGGNVRPIDPAFDRNTSVWASLNRFAPVWTNSESLVSTAEDHGVTGIVRVQTSGAFEWLSHEHEAVTSLSIDAAGNLAAFTSSEVTRPSEVFLLSLADGSRRQLTRMNAEWLREVQPLAAERFAVPTGEGVEVDCWIMPPAGLETGKTCPVLLNVHGGPFGQYGETFFDEFQVYAGAGYGVVFCNPRGSSGQDTPFEHAIVGDMGNRDYHDVMKAFEAALERMPWADRSRLGVMGGSYGGFMTTWIIGHDHRFAAACSERAVNDWYGMQGESDIGSTFNTRYLGKTATIHEDLDAVLRQSPLTYAKDIQTPVLILHSDSDLRCPIGQAEQLFVILKLLRKDVEFVRFPDENHEMSRSGRPSHRKDRFDVILDYFGRKLRAGSASTERARAGSPGAS